MDLMRNKDLGKAGGEVLDKRARHLYGVQCFGASWHGGNNSMNVAPECKLHLDNAADPALANTLLDDIAKPTCVATLLQIVTDVGELVAEDVTDIVADPTDVKYAKVALVKDDATGAIEVVVYEKTTGAYGDVPVGKTHVADLKEFSVPAAGAALTEINNWI